MCACVFSGMKLGESAERWDGLTSHGGAVAGAGAEARFPKQQS